MHVHVICCQYNYHYTTLLTYHCMWHVHETQRVLTMHYYTECCFSPSCSLLIILMPGKFCFYRDQPVNKVLLAP